MTTSAPLAPDDTLAWSDDRVGELLTELARAAGIEVAAVEVPRLVPPGGPHREWLDEAVERSAAWVNVEAEAVDATQADLEPLLRRAAPALIAIGEATKPRLLALLRTTSRRAVFLAPSGALETRPLETLREWLVPDVAKRGVRDVDAMLERARVPSSRWGRARAALLQHRYAHARVEGVWILRRPASAPFLAQLRAEGVPMRLVGLATLHVAQLALFAASWWVLGTSALAGRLDPGWLAAWALLLVTIVPLRAMRGRAEGSLAIDIGTLLKRRLLAGALAVDPDVTKADGAGRTLARVLESSAVETLALDAGGGVLFAAIDLVAAAIALGAGAMAVVELMLLAVCVAIAASLGVALHRRRDEWTDVRLALTHEMVEGLVGHRTRMAQESRDDWHHAEDEAASRALDASRRLDQVALLLAAVLPRVWLVAGIAVLSYALVTAPLDPLAIGVTIAGVLVAFRGFGRAARGAQAVSGVAIAWKRVGPLFDAGGRSEPAASPQVVVQREKAARPSSAPLVEARQLAFGYAGRPRPALTSVTFDLARDEHMLLLGASGGGKSTLGALLAGLRRPSSGLLLLDGLDGRTLGSKAWRRHVASAPQFHENHVFGATFAFNVLMARAWPPRDEDLAEADTVCRELGLGELIDRMPAGLLQTVGETGWQLSHGERSRVFLARALLQRADLVVLDESFAALDPATLATAVQCARRRARALVVIAHP